MFGQIGGQQGIGGPLSPDSIGGESFIRHIGNDELIFDFKSGSGTTVKDRSREGNDGTFGAGAAAPTWKRNSLYFDGGDNVLLTGINHGISTGEFTFCFHMSNLTLNARVYDQKTIRFLIDGGGNAVRLYSTAYKTITDTGIPALSPIRFQTTRDSSGNLECYVNGKMQGKGQTETANLAYNGISVATLGSANNDTGYITGTMYSFRILNKCLSGIEAQQEYLANKFSNN